MKQEYDIIVIGAGPGGHAVAEGSARRGARAVIIEAALWGGVCTHFGCVPTKALLACSKRYADLTKLKRLGIVVNTPSFDFASIKSHQKQMTRISALGVEKSLREAGVILKKGRGNILSPQEVLLTDAGGNRETLTGNNIVIAWGSEPSLPPGITTSGRVLTSDGFLQLASLPKSMIIVGGSVIGVEFATFLAELGVKVTMVELLKQLLPYEDEDAAAHVQQELAKLGVTIHTSTRLETIHETVEAVHAIMMHQDRKIELTAESALICAGRRPRLDETELNRMGIRYTPGGICVDEKQMTNISGIYAVGDITGGAMLAHRAMQQGKSLASRLFGDGSIIYDDCAVPSVVYSHPQIARIGLTEKEAQGRNLKIEVIKSDYAANIIARTELTGKGFVKMLFQADKLIGATVAGDAAADLIASLSFALANGCGKSEMKKWIIPHPTLSEMLVLPNA